jgi:SAM-dependent methyltransferase
LNSPARVEAPQAVPFMHPSPTAKPPLDCEAYRNRPLEQARTAELMRLLPEGRQSILEVGAFDAHFTPLLAARFPRVTALDLQKPPVEGPGIVAVQGDVTALDFPDNSFDCSFCVEVLEHVPALEKACAELTRVTRGEIIIGVPYREDNRMNRLTCSECGRSNPPWGHINRFDETRLRSLFAGAALKHLGFLGSARAATNAVAARLLEAAGNPWGPYYQPEPCIYCGSVITGPKERSFSQKICSAIGGRLERVQTALSSPKPVFMHAIFVKQ